MYVYRITIGGGAARCFLEYESRLDAAAKAIELRLAAGEAVEGPTYCYVDN